jgi:hypothetical protein
MIIKVNYTQDEVSKIILAWHVAKFGTAPVGDKWQYIEVYGAGCAIVNSRLDPKKQIAEDVQKVKD